MLDSARRNFLGLTLIITVLLASVVAASAQVGQATPDALAKTMVSSINAKNVAGVQALIHPQVVSYLRVTDPAMVENITNSLIQLKIPENYKAGVISLEELAQTDSKMAKYDKATQTLTMMGSSAYYKVPPSHLMMLAVEKEKTVQIDGKEERKIVNVPLTPTPLPISQFEGKWYIVIAVGKK
jgi:hypothetical protein